VGHLFGGAAIVFWSAGGGGEFLDIETGTEGRAHSGEDHDSTVACGGLMQGQG